MKMNIKLLSIIALLASMALAGAQSVKPLGLDERAATGFTHKITLDYADVTDAAATSATNVTFRLYPPTSGGIGTNVAIMSAAYVLETPFSTGAAADNATLQLRVGDGGDNNRLAIAGNIGPTNTTFGVAGNTAYVFTSSTNFVNVTLLATNGSTTALDSLTAGEVHVLLKVVDLNKQK